MRYPVCTTYCLLKTDLEFPTFLGLPSSVDWGVLKAYSQEVFHFGYNLQKMVPNHNPEYYPPEEKILRMDLAHLWEVGAIVKNYEPECCSQIVFENLDRKVL